MLDRVSPVTWTGADGGFTTPGPNGTYTWWFGDSVTNRGFLHSSLIIQTDGVMKPITREIIPKTPNPNGDGRMVVYWPSFATKLTNGKLLVICGGIIPTSGWFENAAMKAAYCTVNKYGEVFFERWLNYWPAGMGAAGTPAGVRFDKVVLDPVTKILHLYGGVSDPNWGWNRKIVHCQVAEASVETSTAWSAHTDITGYVTDGSWSPWKDPATNKWHAVSMSPDTTKVYAYSSTNPKSGWTNVEHDRTFKVDGVEGEQFYVAHAHPWLSLPGDGSPRQLACTVSHSKTGNWNTDPYDYRIRFFKIPYPT